MIIEATAPTRIDLAGGTLDIHPLYLLEDGVWTINVAVDVPVSVRIEPRRRGVSITSIDLGRRAHAPSSDSLPLGGPLDLAARAVRASRPRGGLAITLNSAAPPGSGLGASSALLVTLLAALDRWNGARRGRGDLVMAAWRIEAQSLRTLTGRQDYLAPLWGGGNAIHFGLDGDRVEPLLSNPAHRRALQDRLVVAYTGVSHASGQTNWGVIRRYLDGRPGTVRSLRGIADVARRTRAALRAGRIDDLSDLVAEEWAFRRRLAHGVSTPVVERAIAVGRRHGAIAGKACGAGGGGSVLLLVRPGAKSSCEAGLAASGFRVLSSTIVARGLRVSTVPS
jgi:D-glycero-alpha-D-manno-heptose-7-phosphate kinase